MIVELLNNRHLLSSFIQRIMPVFAEVVKVPPHSFKVFIYNGEFSSESTPAQGVLNYVMRSAQINHIKIIVWTACPTGSNVALISLNPADQTFHGISIP
jgi:hypothetical protein